METQQPKKLPEAVAKKYQMLEGHGVGEYHWQRHRVNLVTIDLETADRLVGEGFPYLVTRAEAKKAAAAALAAQNPA
jgi:hypothetical protein